MINVGSQITTLFDTSTNTIQILNAFSTVGVGSNVNLTIYI